MSSGGFGGGIYNARTLTVINVVFSGNRVAGGGFGGGGGIYTRATATVDRSTFSGNSASGCGTDAGNLGGGILVQGGDLAVTASTFADNDSCAGGAILASPRSVVTPLVPSTVSIANCTFARNTIGQLVGAAFFVSAATITNSTFVDDTVNSDSAVEPLLIRNTILANGRCAGNVTDGGHNVEEGTSCGFTGANDSLSNTDPLLDPAGLKDNGGPTKTIALLPGSPAINAGDADVCANPPVNGIDQRGYGRPGTGSTACSIGAYEYNSPGPPAGCVGDCGGDGAVTITELITMVNIALDTANISACTAGDTNHDGQILIDEIVRAVDAALNGCTDPAQACVDSGGQVTEVPCFCPSTPDFFDSCGVGACSCSPTGEPRHLNACDCGAGKCWNSSTCVERLGP